MNSTLYVLLVCVITLGRVIYHTPYTYFQSWMIDCSSKKAQPNHSQTQHDAFTELMEQHGNEIRSIKYSSVSACYRLDWPIIETHLCSSSHNSWLVKKTLTEIGISFDSTTNCCTSSIIVYLIVVEMVVFGWKIERTALHDIRQKRSLKSSKALILSKRRSAS